MKTLTIDGLKFIIGSCKDCPLFVPGQLNRCAYPIFGGSRRGEDYAQWLFKKCPLTDMKEEAEE